MEIALSVFLGEISHRSVSFFLDKLSSHREAAAASLPADEALRRKLLRVRVVVEEVEGRQIRHQAMLEQLKLLRAGMYRGYYVLDAFWYRRARQEEGGHGAESHPFYLSKFNPAKRYRGSSHGGEKELQQAIGSLEVTITNASEFIVFLKACPPLYRQMYSTYLVLEKCMFGRHAEMEHIVTFLTHKGSHGRTTDFDVLPIVGSARAGKSTLIQHVCNEERVRAAFSTILLFTQDDLDGSRLTSVSDGGTAKHQTSSALAGKGERVLVIVEVGGDIDEETWSSLHNSVSKTYTANGGKIIICSRSEKIARLGTGRALRVEHLTQEAYWYFFKALAFGSADPEDEPRLASMAMEIAAGLNGSFIAANIMASMMRANFSAKFWRMVLSCAKQLSRRRYRFMFGAHPASPLENKKRVQILDGSNDYCLVFNDYQIVSAQDEAPVTTFQEVLLGSVEPQGTFDVVAWRSSIPPHYSYILSCEIHRAPQLNVRKKQRV